jgi:hypothetical protein
MTRSSSPITNQDGTSSHSDRSPEGSTSASCVAGRWVTAIRAGHGLSHIRAEQVMEAILPDVQVGCAVAALHRPERRLPGHAAGELAGQRDAALAGLRSETVDVDESDDLTGVGVGVGDHGAGVGVSDEHHGPLDRANEIADRLRVSRDAA